VIDVPDLYAGYAQPSEVIAAVVEAVSLRVCGLVLLRSFWRRFDRRATTDPVAPRNARYVSGCRGRAGTVAEILLPLLCSLSLVGQTAGPPASASQSPAPDIAAPSISANPETRTNSTASAEKSAKTSESSSIGTIEGKVKSGNTPIPGATVSATNPATGQKIVGWTLTDGSYKLALPTAGEYVIRAQMSAFSASTQRIGISPSNAHPKLDLQLTLLSRAPSSPGGAYSGSGRPGGGGFQALSVMAGEAGNNGGSSDSNESVAPLGMPVPGIPPSLSTESVAVSGSNSSGNVFNMSSDEMRARIQEYRNQQGIPGAAGGPGGGFGPGGGPGGGGFGGPLGGGGGRRGGFNFNKPHGMLYYTANTSSLNAAPYSLTGAPAENPGYLQQRFGVSIGGPLNIPHIYHGGSKTFFFLNYNGGYGDTLYSYLTTVPTALERGGDFSQTLLNGQPVQIFNPATGLPFANATIPQGTINSAAQGLLSYIPTPNLSGTTQNFRYITAATINTTDLNIRLNQALGGSSVGPGRGRARGPQNNLSFGVHYHNVDQTLTDPFPSVGGHTTTDGLDIPIGYVRSFGKVVNNFRFDFNRSTINTNNLYAFNTDITGDLGIIGVSQNPFAWGLPNLSFTHYGGITDTNPVNDRNQTWSFTDFMICTHGKHTLRWGGDFRRIQLNVQTDSNPRGSFVFTGAATSQFVNGMAVTGTGYDFADFLLGLSQQTSVQYGYDRYYFRGNSWDLYVQDEWRARGNLTFNVGLRYEYVSPLSESNNRIVNLDTNSGFSEVAPVHPDQVGPVSGMYYPITLVNPNSNNFAPRIGVAWKAAKNTVVRAGYGINYNTAAYQNIVQNMAFQPPYSNTQTNVASSTNILTLQNGFPATSSLTNNYGIDLNYGLGYVQIWNLDIQQEITPTLIVNLDYTGTKGTRLDILTAPNSTASGIRIPGVQAFYYESSDGDSTANAGSVRVRKRLAKGVSLGGTFTWSKSLDDASTIGAGSSVVSANGKITGVTVVAQNAFDLAAERGLSSFDQEFRFTGDYLWELPFGKGRRWLSSAGKKQDFLGGWQYSGDWTIASGLPFTPRLLGSYANVNSGVNGTLRADVSGLPASISNPSINEWFNTAAFVTPPAGQYGNARRNSIEGPGQVLFDMAMTKLIPLKESRTVELRVSSNNVFNHPIYSSIDTVVNSLTYGRVISVGSMRTVLMTVRFRF
jgi:trimeric autotransporter adhesin